MPKSNVDDMLKELEKLAEEIDVPTKRKASRRKKKQQPVDEDALKGDLDKVKEIKKSLDVLEKEVFIKINNPDKIVSNLVEGKKIVKDITTSLMALTKLNKLRDEIIAKLERDINNLKTLSREMEKELNLEEYSKTLGEEIPSLNQEVINQYIDTIEEDIEEIRRYIGIAK